MSQLRRQDDRRRRVLMTSASVNSPAPTASSRSRIEALREARQPNLIYGSRVRECLRGRWYSLVPVDRGTLAKIFAVLATIALAIILLNDATVRFASIQNRPQFVDVFQIPRYGSLGRYFIGVMYLGLASTAWLVYQLRRYRNDDFRGDYRLWQWITGISILASVATLVPLIAMSGTAVEWLMGRRIALSGQDWIGLFLIIGGGILAMRSVAEMWRYRNCMLLMVCGWLVTAIPIASQWNIISVDTNLRWTLVSSAPLLAVTFWFASSLSYLRLLFREVRGMEPAIGVLDRMRMAREQWAANRAENRAESLAQAAADTESLQSRRAAAKRTATTPAATKPAATQTPPAKPVAKPNAAATAKPETVRGDDQSDNNHEVSTPRAKRRWFGLRGPKSIAEEASETVARDDRSVTQKPAIVDSSDEMTEPKPRRKWWPSLRRQPKPDAADEAERTSQVAAKTDEQHSQEEPPKKRRFGLGSMMNRKAAIDQDPANEDAGGSSSNRSVSSAPDDDDANDDDNDGDGDGVNDDDIDWSNMNKAERRRMRKELKRSGRAA